MAHCLDRGKDGPISAKAVKSISSVRIFWGRARETTAPDSQVDAFDGRDSQQRCFCCATKSEQHFSPLCPPDGCHEENHRKDSRTLVCGLARCSRLGFWRRTFVGAGAAAVGPPGTDLCAHQRYHLFVARPAQSHSADNGFASWRRHGDPDWRTLTGVAGQCLDANDLGALFCHACRQRLWSGGGGFDPGWSVGDTDCGIWSSHRRTRSVDRCGRRCSCRLIPQSNSRNC